MGRILRLERLPGVIGWALNATTSVLIRERQKEIRQKEEDQCDHKGKDRSDVTTSYGMLAAIRSWKQGMDSPLEPPEGAQPADTAMLAEGS